MHSNTEGCSDVAGHYILTSHECLSGRFFVSSFCTLAELAKAANALPVANSCWSVKARHVNLRAFSPRGRELDVGQLMAYGSRLKRTTSSGFWWWRPMTGYVHRGGPVPGVRACRGRGYRRFAHMNERSAACLVLSEEGEVAPRGARNAHNITNPRDYEIWPSRS